MSFYHFKENFYELGCFSIHQVFAWNPDFDSSALTRWCSKGYVLKLRNGYYAFPEYLNVAGFGLYIANQIYKPSYISIYYALNTYGLIPETILNFTSVTTLKTATFSNRYGTFSYRTIKPALMFGYKEKPFMGRAIYFAALEKAILDLLYLFPSYNTEQEIEELRFDENVLKTNLKKRILFQYLKKYNSPALEKRIELLIKTYKL